MELPLEVKRVNSAALGQAPFFRVFQVGEGRKFFVPLASRGSRASGRFALAFAC